MKDCCLVAMKVSVKGSSWAETKVARKGYCSAVATESRKALNLAATREPNWAATKESQRALNLAATMVSTMG